MLLIIQSLQKKVLLNCKSNVKERMFDKDKMSKRKKSTLDSWLFAPLISK